MGCAWQGKPPAAVRVIGRYVRWLVRGPGQPPIGLMTAEPVAEVLFHRDILFWRRTESYGEAR